ncbi:phage portal protein [Citrobacter youngae]
MLNGTVPNDELFGVIYTVDEGDDWTDPKVLEKANPNMGVSVYRDFLLSQQQRAINNARQAGVFKTKHLNIWVAARAAFFNLVSWQNCEDKTLTLEMFEGQPCVLAFDLARKLDMNSMARLFTREIDGKTHYYSVAPRFWVPYDTVFSVEKNEDRRTAERFQKWVEMELLTVTDGAEVDYQVTFPDGSTDVLGQDDIWHVRTLTFDGLVGLNPIAYAREAISLGMATEEHGARLFSNGAVTSGVLRTDSELSDAAYARLKADFEEKHQGLGNAHRPMILEMGLDWKSMALNAEDSQFLETRKFQLEEICRLFRVPMHMVQNTDRSTFNNIENLGMGFINYSLVPYMTRIEQRINIGLVKESKQGVYYAKFNAGALLRGDMKSRFEAYSTGINWGIYSPNDCRELEELNPRAGGDIYLTPMNMTTKPSDSSKNKTTEEQHNADD